MTVASNSMIWISTEVVTALFGCYMAGATWNCCHLSASSVYIIQPCISLLCLFIQSHICGVHVCLAATGRFHFWQNNQDLLHATVATQGWNGYWNKSQQRIIFSCCSWWDLNPRPFNWESIALPPSHPHSPCHCTISFSLIKSPSFCVW